MHVVPELLEDGERPAGVLELLDGVRRRWAAPPSSGRIMSAYDSKSP